ncbi:receptor-like serine/threonine-protein kinase SD1-8 isoform X1 [Olea europaea var. sylvestris]|uniref:receptor-like serine/threonine-protein kinase SD1-8 isoform X1 n=1 Tax=Olea europaea var. sylvestris TaxID=158386 RepID=UPI000C1D3AC5|nr:receptor-like serine/threonine-protein kinase SD1-8 isoform X1 [Olea europaea var. sylvestris]
MKLGVNHRTGRNWHLTSRFGEDNPASGAFTLEWDPGTRMLIVRRRGLIYWTSGNLKDYTNQSLRLNVKEFENIPKPDFEDFNYNLTNVSNGVEDHFRYSRITYPTAIHGPLSGWQLSYNWDIFDTYNGTMIAKVSLCHGYNIYKGCESWEQPICRNHNEIFVLKSGHFANGNGSEPIAESVDDYNLTEKDCREKCWKDCECVGFARVSHECGCTFWKEKILTFVQNYDGSKPKQFVLVLKASESSTKRWKSWEIITLVISVVALLLGCVWFIIRKIKQGKKKKEELRELMTLEGYTETHPVESDRGQGHHLRLFMYSSILRATGNFSSTNKLGEGGFGPVYKVQLRGSS